jgi:triphosphatase
MIRTNREHVKSVLLGSSSQPAIRACPGPSAPSLSTGPQYRDQGNLSAEPAQRGERVPIPGHPSDRAPRPRDNSTQGAETTLATPEPDLDAIGDRRLRRKIVQVNRTSSLEPLFETVVRRTTRKLHAEKGDLELAFDEGVVRAGRDEGELCEAELELKAGSPACLLEVATRLFASGSLRLVRMSKADRGYNLLLGRRDESIVPRRALRATLKGEESCAEALALLIQSANAQMVANRSVVLETDDPEGAHQLRIGLRRLRSALRTFRRLDDSSVLREIDRHARELARAVGRLDDANGLIEGILAPVAGRMKGEAGFVELRESLATHRLKVRDEVRQQLLAASGRSCSSMS